MKKNLLIGLFLCALVLVFSFNKIKFYEKPIPALTSVDIGGIKEGATTLSDDGKKVKLKGYGTMFGMHKNTDQGRFAYTKVKGDFDIIAQVESVTSSTEAFAEGGLMVRKDLDPKGLMVANFVTNNNYKSEADQFTYMFRCKNGGSIEPYHNIIENYYGERTFGNTAFGYAARGWNKTNTPARNYPYVWLRIIRTGNLYKGYRKVGTDKDWGKWEKLAEFTVDLGEEPMVGIALSANHHHPTIYGKIGDPESASEISILKITGLGD